MRVCVCGRSPSETCWQTQYVLGHTNKAKSGNFRRCIEVTSAPTSNPRATTLAVGSVVSQIKETTVVVG